MTLVVGQSPADAPGFRWDGQHSGDFGMYLLRSPFPLQPATRDNYLAIPGRHGDWDFGFDFEGRAIELEVVIRASSEAELWSRARSIAAWLDPAKGERPLSLDAEPDKYYKARLAGAVTVEPVAAGIGRATLPFRASDPFAYAVEDDVFTYAGPGLYQFTRKGTAPSHPRFEITGTSPASGRFTITLNGKAIRYTGALAAGETLVLDSETLTAYRQTPQGALSAIAGLDSLDFPVAVPGSNTLALAVEGGATLTQARITCRSRWL